MKKGTRVLVQGEVVGEGHDAGLILVKIDLSYLGKDGEVVKSHVHVDICPATVPLWYQEKEVRDERR